MSLINFYRGEQSLCQITSLIFTTHLKSHIINVSIVLDFETFMGDPSLIILSPKITV
jgi:hypothetical protein